MMSETSMPLPKMSNNISFEKDENEGCTEHCLNVQVTFTTFKLHRPKFVKLLGSLFHLPLNYVVV